MLQLRRGGCAHKDEAEKGENKDVDVAMDRIKMRMIRKMRTMMKMMMMVKMIIHEGIHDGGVGDSKGRCVLHRNDHDS